MTGLPLAGPFGLIIGAVVFTKHFVRQNTINTLLCLLVYKYVILVYLSVSIWN